VTLRISYAPWGETLAEMADAARRAEQAGAQAVWAPELHRSATVTAAALGAATSTAHVGTAVALAFTRSPMTLALEALDLDELTGGRFVLGIGTGVRALNERWHNVPFGKPAQHLRETVRNLRAFWVAAHEGEPLDLDGEFEPMRITGYRRPFAPRRPTVPVYVAAMGPVMTRVAGSIGDGWISHELCSPAYLRECVQPELDKGLSSAGRTRPDLDVVVSVLCAVDGDAAPARRWAAGTVGFYASVATYRDFFAFHGFADAQERVMATFRSGRSSDELAETVGDEMVHALTAAGTPEDVRARVEAYDGLADMVKLSPPTHGIEPAQTRACQERILDLLPEMCGGHP
jgi:probable F420-dependent oxidoreductase